MHFRSRTHAYNPWEHLEYMGAEIVYGTTMMKESGIWIQEAGLVVLRPGMSPRLERCVLAHEAVHCEYNDARLAPGPEHDRRERRTNTIAAMRLIPCTAWRALDGCSIREMCERLNVVPGIVKAYERCTQAPWEVLADVGAA